MESASHRSAWSLGMRDARRVVIGIALVVLIPKLVLAWNTLGSNDIGHWKDFLRGVRADGPVGVYSFPFTRSLYNHPPLIGYYLVVLDATKHIGLSFPFALRAVSCLADVASAVIVFEIIRRRRPLNEATIAGIFVAANPILFIISGYHGNTDPVFVMLTLLSAHLLVDRDKPALAGVSMALAVGIKIVPIVAVPVLAVYAFTRGRHTFARFATGLVVTSLTFWTPALLTQWGPLHKNVLGYAGGAGKWGITQLSSWAGFPALGRFMDGPGRTLVVAACALVPAYLVWRYPSRIMYGLGLSLVGFLALTPGFGTQYMAWAAAPIFLLGWRIGVAFNVLGGALLFHVYDRWSDALPWDWHQARATVFVSSERIFGIFVWAVLVSAVIGGIRQFPTMRKTRPMTNENVGGKCLQTR